MTLREIFNSISPVDDDSYLRIEELCRPFMVKKGEQLIRQGEYAREIFFLGEGIVRLYFASGGKERTVCFGTGGDPFTSVASYKSRKPSLYGIECMSDCSGWAIAYEAFRQLADSCPDINRWFMNLLLEQLEALEMRSVLFGTLNATGRYEAFVLKRSEIFRNVPAKYIAQYLQIAPETLSRIMAAYARK